MEPRQAIGISVFLRRMSLLPRVSTLSTPPLGQLIIAGGDDEITPADLIDWIHPLLCGIPSGLWMTCEIAAADRGCLTARIRNGAIVPHLALCSTIPRKQAAQLQRLLPEPPPLALILLSDHAAQAMALLDGLASWLNVFEAHEPAIAPIISLLNNPAGTTMPRKRAPRAGPL